MITFWEDVLGLIPKLEQYDMIFACERAAVDLMRYNVPLAAVVSDFDSIENRQETIDALRQQADVVVLSPIKDESDSKALLIYIQEHVAYESLDIYNSFDKRIDHALALLSFFQAEKQMRIITPQTEITYYEAGVHQLSYSVVYPYISFIVIEALESIKLTNFKYPLDKASVEIFSDLLISNEIKEGNHAILDFKKGKILAIRSRDVTGQQS